MADPTPEKPEEGSVAARERAKMLVGRTIADRYKIQELIAMGGMGGVYRAQHLQLRKRVAIKVLHPETEGFPELVTRFEREAVAGAHIEHPNVATASDFGKFDGESRFLVLELIRGSTLRELMSKGPLPAERAARIVRQIAVALSAVHSKGIVHRDIKPRNIMIIDETRRTRRISSNPSPRMGEDVVKLIDFGLSKVPVDELDKEETDLAKRDLTQAGVVMGTIGYLAPEAALGMSSVLAPADLYSVGVIFYELLAGKPPFEGGLPMQLFAKHRLDPVPPIAERNPDVKVPPEMEAIARRLLEKDPGDRYPSADALADALDAALAVAPASIRGSASHTKKGASMAPPSARGSGTRRATSVAPPGSPSTSGRRPPSIAPRSSQAEQAAVAKLKAPRLPWIIAAALIVVAIIIVVAVTR